MTDRSELLESGVFDFEQDGTNDETAPLFEREMLTRWSNRRLSDSSTSMSLPPSPATQVPVRCDIHKPQEQQLCLTTITQELDRFLAGRESTSYVNEQVTIVFRDAASRSGVDSILIMDDCLKVVVPGHPFSRALSRAIDVRYDQCQLRCICVADAPVYDRGPYGKLPAWGPRRTSSGSTLYWSNAPDNEDAVVGGDRNKRACVSQIHMRSPKPRQMPGAKRTPRTRL